MPEVSTLEQVFPFEYSGGGYFRRRGIPKDIPADILHGMQAIQFVYDAMKTSNQPQPNAGTTGEKETTGG